MASGQPFGISQADEEERKRRLLTQQSKPVVQQQHVQVTPTNHTVENPRISPEAQATLARIQAGDPDAQSRQALYDNTIGLVGRGVRGISGMMERDQGAAHWRKPTSQYPESANNAQATAAAPQQQQPKLGNGLDAPPQVNYGKSDSASTPAVNAESVAAQGAPDSKQSPRDLTPEQLRAAFDEETRQRDLYQKAGGGKALQRGDKNAYDAINAVYKARGQQTGETIKWEKDANGNVSVSGYGARNTPREEAIKIASDEYSPRASRIAAMEQIKLLDAANPDYATPKDKADIALKESSRTISEANARFAKQQQDELQEYQKLAANADDKVLSSQRFKELKFKFAPDTTLANDPLLKELASKIGGSDGIGGSSADKAYWMRYYQLHPATRGFKYDEIMDLVDRQMGVEVKRANGGIIPGYAFGGIVDDSESMYSLNADIGSGRAGRAQAVSDANLMGKVEQWKQAVGFDDMSSTEQRNATVGLGGMNQPSGGRALRNYQNAQAAILSDKIGAIKSANSAGNETGFGVSKPTIEKPVATDDLFDKMYEDEFTFAKGGAVNVSGKRIIGPGTAKSDSIPAIIDGDPSRPAALSTGEYVMPVEAVRHYGVDRLNKMKDKAIKAMNGRG